MFIRLNKAKILRSASCLLFLFVVANTFAPHWISLHFIQNTWLNKPSPTFSYGLSLSADSFMSLKLKASRFTSVRRGKCWWPGRMSMCLHSSPFCPTSWFLPSRDHTAEAAAKSLYLLLYSLHPVDCQGPGPWLCC